MKTDLICHAAEAIVVIVILIAMAFCANEMDRAEQFKKALKSCSSVRLTYIISTMK